jgi:uncharacterized Tic20 family protein
MNFTGTAEPAASPTQDDRTWGMLAHLSTFIGLVIPFGTVIAPLVIWLVKKDQSAFIAENAKEALNFNITLAIVGVVCWILVFVFIGVLLFVVLAIYWLAMTILAALKANEGNIYRYGISLRLVK